MGSKIQRKKATIYKVVRETAHETHRWYFLSDSAGRVEDRVRDSDPEKIKAEQGVITASAEKYPTLRRLYLMASVSETIRELIVATSMGEAEEAFLKRWDVPDYDMKELKDFEVLQ